jgi:riboflavin biosynthesis pyrimidine reductase
MIQRLIPDCDRAAIPLAGLYLGLNLRREADDGELLIYSNFVASVDGRISRFNTETDDYAVPDSLANERDWRLYQELAAQSDILITSARYFRQLSKGTAQDMLPVGSGFDDLKQWRVDHGLKSQPDVAILSNSLEIPLAALELLNNRTVYLFTSAFATKDKREWFEAQGVKVITAGEKGVEGARLKTEMIRLGFKSAYMIAGPQVHRTLIEAGVLDRLFLTTRFTLLGSEQTHGFYDGGNQIRSAVLKSLYLDEVGQQLFAQYSFGDE